MSIHKKVMSSVIPDFPGDATLEPIHRYAYQLNMQGIQSELAKNIDSLNRYTQGIVAIHPLYMVFLRMKDTDTPSKELISVMDFFLTHPKLDKNSLNTYSSWIDRDNKLNSVNPFGVFLAMSIDKQESYRKQFVECLKAGADIRFQFATEPLNGIRYRDYILSATDDLYSSLMIKLLNAIKIEQLVWTEKFDDSLLLKAITLQKTNSLYLLLESKIFDVNTKDADGSSLLHYLVASRTTKHLLDTYILLLQFGADVNHKNKDGKSALVEFLGGYIDKDLTDEEKNLIWNMCIISFEYGYKDINGLYQFVTEQIQLGPEYYLPIEEAFYDTD